MRRKTDSEGVVESNMSNTTLPILLETHYLPSIEYFVLLSSAKHVVLHGDENFQKQSYRNRCYIAGPNKTQLLTVPVEKKTRKGKIKDVLISYDESWHMEQVQTLQTAYGKAPFFEYYFEFFEKILLAKKKYLWDLNNEMLTLCLNLLNIDSKISDSGDCHLNLNELDNRHYGEIDRKRAWTERDIYKETKYHQLFGSNFVPNLSVIDLLFCEGPNSSVIIGQSTIK
ncbi:MAG: WbqC family protein [Cyclobacteriaceae bacterium]